MSNYNDFRKKVEEYKQIPHRYDRRNTKVGNRYEDNNDLFFRDEFSRDRDRIKFCRAFRRLEHKAQIYSHEKGDHFRTRLTHTLEVCQIARSLAKNLKLNEELVEAISLGHDIGHTPFGHQGERTLDKIMTGEDDLSGKIKYGINYGGFKHNFHSLKIVDMLEVKYQNEPGMNLTWQVMEGIVKHTKIKRHKKDQCNDQCKSCSTQCWDLKRFVVDENFIKDYMKYPFSVTLEGQLVAVADEIAQRQHDLDDGLRDRDLGITYDKIAEYLIEELNEIILRYSENTDMEFYLSNVKGLREQIETIKEVTKCDREELYKINRFVRQVIDFFIKDVTVYSMNSISDNADKYMRNENGRKYFINNMISFSEIGREVNDVIEKYIKTKILNSYNVNRFDGKAVFIVRKLFKAYYANPRQMPQYKLNRLIGRIKGVCNDIYNVKFKDGKEIKSLCFADTKPQVLEKLLRLMKLELNIDELELPKDFNVTDYFIDNGREQLSEETVKRINKLSYEEITSENDKFMKALIEIHYAFLSIICDYTAGMTDNFACSEFKELYLV